MVKKEKRLAEAISWILNPAFLAIIILLVAVWRSPMNPNEHLSWSLGVVILDGIIPLFFYLFFTKKGYIFDDTLNNPKVQKERVKILLVFSGIIAFQFLILASTRGFQPLLLVLTGGLIAMVLALLITYFWKISLHAGMITLFVLMFILLYGWQKSWPTLFLIPLVFWARLVLRRHTMGQLLAGALFACLVVFFTLFLFGVFPLRF